MLLGNRFGDRIGNGYLNFSNFPIKISPNPYTNGTQSHVEISSICTVPSTLYVYLIGIDPII